MATGMVGTIVVWAMLYTTGQFVNVEAMDTTVSSSHGIPCKTSCSKEDGTSYNWCTTIRKWKSHTWDYCSPIAGYDYKDKKCSSPCDYTGHNYKWCYLAEGGWGYCSEAAERENNGKKIASYGNACKTSCGKGDGTKYNWCRTETKYKGHDWDYCSATDGHDYKGHKCTSKCEHRGYKYNWCYIEGGWGYCSPDVLNAFLPGMEARGGTPMIPTTTAAPRRSTHRRPNEITDYDAQDNNF